MATQVTENGVLLIAKFEKFIPKAYYATEDERRRGLKTIGYGHLIRPGEDDYLNVISLVEEQALILLDKDICRFEVGVVNLLDGGERRLTDNQFDAVVSLAFNIGLGGFAKSNVRNMIQQGHVTKAGPWFASFTKQSGTRLKGLVRRRAIEKILYETGKDKYDEVFAGTIDPYKELGLTE